MVNFVINIFNLEKVEDSIKLKTYLSFISYTSMLIGFSYIGNIISYNQFIKARVYIILFTLILYAAITKYKEKWLYKAFMLSWLSQWLLYIYLNIFDQFKFKILILDIRIIEYLETFVNLLLISSILLYNAKELKNYGKIGIE